MDEERYRPHGRAPRGQQVNGERSGQKPYRLTVIAAYHEERLKAPFRFEGYTNTGVSKRIYYRETFAAASSYNTTALGEDVRWAPALNVLAHTRLQDRYLQHSGL